MKNAPVVEWLVAYVVAFQMEFVGAVQGDRPRYWYPIQPASFVSDVKKRYSAGKVMEVAKKGLEADWNEDEFGPFSDWKINCGNVCKVCEEWIIGGGEVDVTEYSPRSYNPSWN